jgi:hypothetical protein
MNTNAAGWNDRQRHFGRGRSLLIALPAALLFAACSRNLGNDGQTGSAGSTGTGQGGDGGRGGVGGGAGGIGGAGAGGIGGAPVLPVCPSGTATFSVCAVSNADSLPLPEMSRDSVVAAAATVEAVGMGTPPAQCGNARVFGAATNSEWWLQLRTADSVLWTIGLGGLGTAPFVQTGDAVRLDLEYQVRPRSGPTPATAFGSVQLSNSAGTPLLWAGSNAYGATWLTLQMGQTLCGQKFGAFGCPSTRYEVIATVNGSVATIAPFSAVRLGGYTVAVGEYAVQAPNVHTECSVDGPPPFTAAAVKAP